MTKRLEELRAELKVMCEGVVQVLGTEQTDVTTQMAVYDNAALPLIQVAQAVYMEYYKIHMGKKIH